METEPEGYMSHPLFPPDAEDARTWKAPLVWIYVMRPIEGATKQTQTTTIDVVHASELSDEVDILERYGPGLYTLQGRRLDKTLPVCRRNSLYVGDVETSGAAAAPAPPLPSQQTDREYAGPTARRYRQAPEKPINREEVAKLVAETVTFAIEKMLGDKRTPARDPDSISAREMLSYLRDDKVETIARIEKHTETMLQMVTTFASSRLEDKNLMIDSMSASIKNNTGAGDGIDAYEKGINAAMAMEERASEARREAIAEYEERQAERENSGSDVDMLRALVDGVKEVNTLTKKHAPETGGGFPPPDRTH